MEKGHRAALLVVALVAALLGAGPAASAQVPDPSISLVELRPDRTLAVDWQASASAGGYEVGVRQAGQANWTVAATLQAPAEDGEVRRVLTPGVDWTAQRHLAYEVAVRVNDGAWSTPAPVRLDITRPTLAATGSGPTGLDLSWSEVPAGEPFVRYDLFVAGADERTLDCHLSNALTRTVTTATAGRTGCGAVLTAATDYTVALQVVRNASPLVVDEVTVATGTTTGGQAIPAERFRTAQVGNTWQIVNAAGQPVIWNGINVRRGELTSFAFSSSEFTAMLDKGFDSVRIALEWDTFELERGVFDQASFAALDRAVNWAEDAGIDLILDPLHLAEGPAWNVPDWAWRASNDGEMEATAVLDAVRENSADYLRHVAGRYRSRAHVIAIDLLNEPREPAAGQNLDQRNGELVMLLHDLVETVRDLEPDKPLILQPYYGSSVISTSRLASIDDPTLADPVPNQADFDNLIWSIHDYYAGREGGPTDDGYTNGGYPLRGAAPDGTRYRTESWTTSGCYPSGPSVDECTNDTSRADVLRPSMREHLRRHYDAAQAVGMPLYVGEFGIPHSGFGWPGWGGAEEYLTDKVATFDALGVSRAVWIWRVDVDPTFGLYDRATRSWHSWTDYATGAAASGLGADGDANCDGTRNVGDALAIAQYEVGIRTGAECPLSDPATQLNLARADINGSGSASIADALVIAQCEVGIPTGFC